jgi:hypothetical protein
MPPPSTRRPVDGSPVAVVALFVLLLALVLLGGPARPEASATTAPRPRRTRASHCGSDPAKTNRECASLIAGFAEYLRLERPRCPDTVELFSSLRQAFSKSENQIL